MAEITHGVTGRNVLANAMAAGFDVGSTNATGRVQLLTSGDVVLAEFATPSSEWSAASGGDIAASGINSIAPAVAGLASKARAINRDAEILFEGTVTEEGEYPVDDPLEGAVIVKRRNVTTDEAMTIVSILYRAPV